MSVWFTYLLGVSNGKTWMEWREDDLWRTLHKYRPNYTLNSTWNFIVENIMRFLAEVGSGVATSVRFLGEIGVSGTDSAWKTWLCRSFKSMPAWFLWEKAWGVLVMLALASTTLLEYVSIPVVRSIIQACSHWSWEAGVTWQKMKELHMYTKQGQIWKKAGG